MAELICHAPLSVYSRRNTLGQEVQVWHQSLGLLICPKVAKAKIMIKHSAFLYNPPTQKNKNKTKKLRRKKMVLYMGGNNINSKLTDKG